MGVTYDLVKLALQKGHERYFWFPFSFGSHKLRPDPDHFGGDIYTYHCPHAGRNGMTVHM